MVDELAELQNADRSLFPSNFTIRAVRDSRYHNTAYAIAELIDNSIEANARQIDLLCMERHQSVGPQTRRRVSEVAVLDNGDGMDVKTLLDALKFGGGTRHNSGRGIENTAWVSPPHLCPNAKEWTYGHGKTA